MGYRRYWFSEPDISDYFPDAAAEKINSANKKNNENNPGYHD
jgi:hypothetical protein